MSDENLPDDPEHPLMLGKRWGDKAEANIDKWGSQRHDTLLLALIEEVGEVAMAIENNCGPGEGAPPVGDYDDTPHRGRDLIGEMADLGRRTRDLLESEYPDPAGDGDGGAECRIAGDPMDAARIAEEVEDVAPLCWQLYWALQAAPERDGWGAGDTQAGESQG